MTIVRVQIPYLPERIGMLTRVMLAYRAQSFGGQHLQCVSVKGYTWGEGQNQLLARLDDEGAARPDYVLTGNDDCIPHPGAIQAAIRFHVETGDLPACRFLQDGQPLDPSYDARPHGAPTPWMRMFFAPPEVFERVGPLLDLTWYTDIDYCQRLVEHGYRMSLCDGFTFDHLDSPRTWAENGEALRQHGVYREACAAAGRSPLA